MQNQVQTAFRAWVEEDSWRCRYDLRARQVMWAIFNNKRSYVLPEFEGYVPDWNRFLRAAYRWWMVEGDSDPLQKRAAFAAEIKAKATPDGDVWVLKWGRDCDQMESSYIRLHDARNVMKLEMDMFDWFDNAEGPSSFDFITQRDAEAYSEAYYGTSWCRDLAAEQMGY